VIHPEWLSIHWPPYWHYDFFQGLRAIAQVGKQRDPRAGEALERLQSLRRADGMWRTGGRKHWRLHGTSNVEAVDWGDAHQVVTPIALGILE
jgi:hypothetical protein